MKRRIVVLGAGFGGLELCTMLSEAVPDELDVTLIDRSDAFVFGFSKLDVMFGRETPEAVRLPYRDVVKPGVRVVRETVTAIDPEARRVTTDAGVHDADALVIALGADYDFDATPGLAEGGNEFYSTAGAQRLASIHRVRSRTGRQRRHRLPVWSAANGHVPRPLRRARRRQEALRRHPSRAVVRHLAGPGARSSRSRPGARRAAVVAGASPQAETSL